MRIEEMTDDAAGLRDERVAAFWRPVVRCRRLFAILGAVAGIGAVVVTASLLGWLAFIYGLFLAAPVGVAGYAIWWAGYQAALKRVFGRMDFPQDLPSLLDLFPASPERYPSEAMKEFADALVCTAAELSQADAQGMASRAEAVRRMALRAAHREQRDLLRGALAVAARCRVSGLSEVAQRKLAGYDILEPGGATSGAAARYLRAAGDDSPVAPGAIAEEEALRRALRTAMQGYGLARERAERELRASGKPAVDAFLARYGAAGRRWYAVRRAITMAAITVGVIVFAGAVYVLQPGVYLPFLVVDAFVNTVCLFVIAIASAWALLLRSRLVRLAALMDDMRTIGLLLGALHSAERQGARAALLEMLPRLRASDASLLGAEDRISLRRLLAGRDVWLILAVLKALAQVGDESDKALVAVLADGRGPARRSRRVRAAAQECLRRMDRRGAVDDGVGMETELPARLPVPENGAVDVERAVKAMAVRERWEQARRCRERLRMATGVVVVVAIVTAPLGIVTWLACLLTWAGARYCYGLATERILVVTALPEDLPSLLDLCVHPANVMPREAKRSLADAIVHAATLADERQLAAARMRMDVFRNVLGSWVRREQNELWRAVMFAATRCGAPGLEPEARFVAERASELDEACRDAAREYLRRTEGAPQVLPTPDAADAAMAEAAARAALRGSGAHRAAAERELVRMGPAGAEALLVQLQTTGPRWRWARRMVDIVAVTLIGVILIAMFLGGHALTTGRDGAVANLCAEVMIVAALASFPVFGLSQLLLRSRAVKLLVGLADRRAVGLLVDALALEDAQASGAARAALLRLLPRLSTSEAALLTAEHRARLRRVLASGDIWFIRAILSAYEQVGDERDIKAVAALAEGRAAARRNDQVRAAAQECLESLQARTEAERPGRTLLRPVTEAPDSETTLVRPAGNAAGEQQLVRPVVEARNQGE